MQHEIFRLIRFFFDKTICVYKTTTTTNNKKRDFSSLHLSPSTNIYIFVVDDKVKVMGKIFSLKFIPRKKIGVQKKIFLLLTICATLLHTINIYSSYCISYLHFTKKYILKILNYTINKLFG